MSELVSSYDLDQNQKLILSELLLISKDINLQLSKPQGLIKKWLQYWQKRKVKLASGVYLHGKVGVGKTVLMQHFFADIHIASKLMVHFQDFMVMVHTELHKIEQKGSGLDKTIKIAKIIAKKTKVLCIDEFEIKDISDAMLVLTLFSALRKLKVFIFITSNSQPEELYKEGLQRQLFLPFINMVNSSYKIFNLKTDMDYRMKRASSEEQKVFFPLTEENKNKIDEIWQKLLGGKPVEVQSISTFGRNIKFSNTCRKVMRCSFQELCEMEFSYADYVNICKHFDVIILEGVRKIKADETNIIIRFINFVDNMYFYRKLLFISLHTSPEYIYVSGLRSAEYIRTVSRLREMNSVDYVLSYSS